MLFNYLKGYTYSREHATDDINGASFAICLLQHHADQGNSNYLFPSIIVITRF